jgi:hypothetical protein
LRPENCGIHSFARDFSFTQPIGVSKFDFRTKKIAPMKIFSNNNVPIDIFGWILSLNGYKS